MEHMVRCLDRPDYTIFWHCKNQPKTLNFPKPILYNCFSRQLRVNIAANNANILVFRILELYFPEIIKKTFLNFPDLLKTD